MFRFAVLLACVVIVNVSTVGVLALTAALVGSVASVSGIVRELLDLRRETAEFEARFNR